MESMAAGNRRKYHNNDGCLIHFITYSHVQHATNEDFMPFEASKT